MPGRGADPIRPPVYAYSGSRGLRRIAVDLKDPDGRGAFESLVRTADVVVESFRPGVVDRLGIGYDALRVRQPRGHPVLDHRLRPVGPALPVGRARHQLPGGGGLPGRHRAGCRRGTADRRGHHRRCRRRGDAGGPGGDGRPDRSRRTGQGAHLDVSIADGVLWLTSLAVDEHLATGADVGPGHDIISGRYACYDTYRAADGRWLAVGAIEPKFYANLCRLLGCEQWLDHQLDDDVQDKIRDDFAAAFATRDRDAWVAALAGADTCVAPVQTVAELAADGQFAARRAFVDAAPDRRRDAVPPGGRRPGRDGAAVRAGGGARPVGLGHRRPAGGGRPADRAHRRASSKGGGGVSAIGEADIDRPDRGRAVRRGGGVPRRAGLHLDDLLVGGERQPAVLGRARWPRG